MMISLTTTMKRRFLRKSSRKSLRKRMKKRKKRYITMLTAQTHCTGRPKWSCTWVGLT